MTTTSPRVTVVVPCFDEAGYVDPLLDQLIEQVGDIPDWRVVLVDDGSTDATPEILAAAAARASHGSIEVLGGRWGSPGGARSAGAALALASPRPPGWLLTIDADVTLAPDFVATWAATLAELDGDESVGAVNGIEQQAHLFDGLPNAGAVSEAFGLGVVAGERIAGVTNLNGVNHAVRVAAYLTAGPYLQPTAPGPDGTHVLAGEDWDLGVRLRRAGFTVAETPATVNDRGRRLLADVHAYVSGEAYEGPFHRITSGRGAVDVPADEVPALVDGAIERSLRHFLLKPILAGAVDVTAIPELSASTTAAMAAWMARWPHPTIDESRNGFVFGRLGRFSHRFSADVRRDLGLDTPLAAGAQR